MKTSAARSDGGRAPARPPGVGRRPARTRILPCVLTALAVALAAACGGERPGTTTAEEVSFPAGWPYPVDAAPVAATGGMVVTTDSLATAAGREMLRSGGNAVDAAVAVQFALAVVHPAAGNIGGGGFLVLRRPDGTAVSLDFREEAPGASTPDMYLDEQGRTTNASWTGHLASGVPGSVAGMVAAHERYGALPWRRVLEPAVRYAEDGIRMDREMHENIAGEVDRLQQFPASAAKWLPEEGGPPAVGDTFRQPALARTLRAVAGTRGDAFYSGWIADSLVAQMERGGGLITREDLAAYEAVWREPIVARYRGHRVISMPPPSSGGVTIAEILNITESFHPDSLGWHSADHVHVAVEAMRRAFGDRNFYLGDPDFVDMPLDRLTSQSYADSLAASIRMDTVSPSGAFNKVPVSGGSESANTTHFSVVDSAGNAVAVTTTVNGYFGSAVTVRGAGFVLNNEMNDFTANPGEPNAYGLVQGKANAIRPGKRMLSSMSPTIVVDPEGRTELVTGTPGGATIITTVYQMVSNHVDFGMPVGTSVNAPRVHHQNLPDEVYYEADGLPDSVVAALRARGHRMVERDGYSGDVASLYVGPADTLYGVADPRRGGAALGPGPESGGGER